MYKEIDQTPYKQEINAKNLIQCWKECMATPSYTLRKAAVEKFNSENYWKKKGLAMVPLKFPVGVGSVAAGQVSSFTQTNAKVLEELFLQEGRYGCALQLLNFSRVVLCPIGSLQRRQELLCPLYQVGDKHSC